MQYQRQLRVSGKRSTRRSCLNFESTVFMIPEKGQVKSMGIPQISLPAYVKRLMTAYKTCTKASQVLSPKNCSKIIKKGSS